MSSYPSLENFISRVQRARGTKSKEFRLTTEEATSIAIEISKLIVLKTIEVEKVDPSNRIDGGAFTKS